MNIKFIPHVGVAIYVDGKLCGVVLPPKKIRKSRWIDCNERVETCIREHLSADDVHLVGLSEFDVTAKSETTTIHVYNGGADYYDDVKLEPVTIY